MVYTNSMDIKEIDGLEQQKRLFFYNQIIAVITDFDTNSNYVNEDVELLYYRLVNEGVITSNMTEVTKAALGLGNVDNTRDDVKPISIPQQNALDLKADKNNPTFTGTVSGVTKAHVGLGNVDNTADINKPISSETQLALNQKSPNGHQHDASTAFNGGTIPLVRLGTSGERNASAILFGDNVWRPFSVTVAGVATVNGQQGDVTVDKAAVGLSNVDNTSDANKPVSTIQQAALNSKADDAVVVKSVNGTEPDGAGNVNISIEGGSINAVDIADSSAMGRTLITSSDAAVSRGAIGAGTASTKADVGLGNVDNTSDVNKPVSSATTTQLNLKAPLNSPAFTGTPTGITKTHVGLGNVDNTSDVNKPVSSATTTQLNLKAPIASPTFTGTVGGITKSMVGLGNVDNTSDINKPVSTLQQAAIDAVAGGSYLPDFPLNANNIELLDPNVFEGSIAGIQGKMVVPTHVTPAGGETTHPSVVYIPAGWNGYKWWMGHTPYPTGNDAHEDPNICASNNGHDFEVPVGLTNPLDNALGSAGSPSGFNSDIHLYFDEATSTMYAFWRHVDKTVTPWVERIKYRTSTNGTTWAAAITCHQTTADVQAIISPSIQKVGSTWYLWGMDMVTKTVVRKTSATLTTGGWGAATTCPITPAVPAGRQNWHLEVRQYGDLFMGILNDCDDGSNGLNGDLYIITSVDGINFSRARQTVIPRYGTDHTALYRASLVPMVKGGIVGFEMFYAGWVVTPAVVWNMFHTWISANSGSENTTIHLAPGTPAANWSFSTTYPGKVVVNYNKATKQGTINLHFRATRLSTTLSLTTTYSSIGHPLPAIFRDLVDVHTANYVVLTSGNVVINAAFNCFTGEILIRCSSPTTASITANQFIWFDITIPFER